MQPTLISRCSTSDRDLYFLSVSNPSLFPEDLSLPSPHFSVFLALDATEMDDAVVTMIARPLLRAGAVYVCCYGPDCERVHDIIDQEEILQLGPIEQDDGSVIMTTWHAHDTLQDALWFFVFNSWPDNKYFNSCRAGIAISCENQAWDDQIIAGMRDFTKTKAS
jgi:hypothetical protein